MTGWPFDPPALSPRPGPPREPGGARCAGRLAAAITAIAAISAASGAVLAAAPAATVIATVSRVLESQRTGVTSRWSVPEVGLGGTIVIERTYRRDDGTPCRSYVRTIEGARRSETVRGTGCRIARDVWTLTEEIPPTERTPALPPIAAAPPDSPRAAPRSPLESGPETGLEPGPSAGSAPPPDGSLDPAPAPPPPAFTAPTPERKPTIIAGALPTPSLE